MTFITTTYRSIIGNGNSLSSSLYEKIADVRNNQPVLEDLLYRKLDRDNLGREVGSINYVRGSDYFFIKTKALQSNSFLPVINSESTESIIPRLFTNYDLKAGDIILSKDSNIGEVVILDRDYPNHMLSGALYRLPLDDQYKYYALAFIKHRYFRQQLDGMVPKGATLRHAGTKFLNCKILLPSVNEDRIIDYVSSICRKIIDTEIEIKNKHRRINDVIVAELTENQNPADDYIFSFASYSDICKGGRLDTGIYSEPFQKIKHLISNYKFGSSFIPLDKLKSGNTPKIRIISPYSDESIRWITPTNCSDYGYIQTHESISTPAKNNLNEDAVLIINRTSRGGKGEYVGISTFYDYRLYGKGYHNQGIYRVTGYPKEMLVFITCFMNSDIIRKYCSLLCSGSKMKEIKSEQFLSIPIPHFPKDRLEEICRVFYNDVFDTDVNKIIQLSPKDVGLFHLSIMKDILMRHLNSVLDMIVDGTEFDVVDNRLVI